MGAATSLTSIGIVSVPGL
jgi:hypothetical protein